MPLAGKPREMERCGWVVNLGLAAPDQPYFMGRPSRTHRLGGKASVSGSQTLAVTLIRLDTEANLSNLCYEIAIFKSKKLLTNQKCH